MIKTIENDKLIVSINTKGGALESIYSKELNKELMYERLENSWQGVDVVIFPFVARLKDGNYTYKDKEYSMKNHGLVRYNEVLVYEETNDSIIFIFESNNDTLLQYPFEFKLLIKYKLIDNELKVSYEVFNKSNEKMYYGIGGHPAFKCLGYNDNGFIYTNTSLDIDNTNSKKVLLNEDGSLMIDILDNTIESHIIPNKELFKKEKTIIFENCKSVTLNQLDYSICVYADSVYYAIWSDEVNGNYIALEPWWSLPDFIDCNKDIRYKKTLQSLDSNSSLEYTYNIKLIIK